MDAFASVDPTGVLSAANAAVKLVGTVIKVAPAVRNAANAINQRNVGAGSTVEQQIAAGALPQIPFDNEQERRAYEKVNMVLKTVGERIIKSGLVDEQALVRALTAVTAHIEVQLFSVENNKLFHSLANRLSDPQLVNNVFTSIYFIAFLTSELQSSLPNYKDTYIPIGQRMIQQMFKVALGLEGFKENLQANLEAYKTLAMTAGLLKPLDLDVTIFRNFPSFGLSKYSSKSYADTRYYNTSYTALVKYFSEKGFPQPLQGRDVGPIRDWRFLAGDANSKVFEVERADKHIGENFGRVLYWLLCIANRLPDGVAVIAYHDQHIQLIRWLGQRFSYRVLNASSDLNMLPHGQMKPKLRSIFNSWVLIMPSQTLLQRRKDAANAIASHATDLAQVNQAQQAAEAMARAQMEQVLQAAQVSNGAKPTVSSVDSASVMSDPILEHIAAKQAEQRQSGYAPSNPSVHSDEIATIISSEGDKGRPMSTSGPPGIEPSPFAGAPEEVVTRSAMPHTLKMSSRSSSAAMLERLRMQMSSPSAPANAIDAQTIPTAKPNEPNEPSPHRLSSASSTMSEMPIRQNSMNSRRPVGSALRQPSMSSVAELHATSTASATVTGPAELSENFITELPTSFDNPGFSNISTANGARTRVTSSSPTSMNGSSAPPAPTRARRKAPPPPKVTQAIAKFDFEPEEPNGEELAFKAGDMIEIVSKDKNLEEDGWCQARIKGTYKVALAPLDYLEEQAKQAVTATPTVPVAAAPAQASMPAPSSTPAASQTNATMQSFPQVPTQAFTASGPQAETARSIEEVGAPPSQAPHIQTPISEVSAPTLDQVRDLSSRPPMPHAALSDVSSLSHVSRAATSHQAPGHSQTYPPLQQPPHHQQDSHPGSIPPAGSRPTPGSVYAQHRPQPQASLPTQMAEPMTPPTGAVQNYYHSMPQAPGTQQPTSVGDNEFTTIPSPRPPQSYVPYNTTPIPVAAGDGQRQTQQAPRVDLSGAHISLFGGGANHHSHQNQDQNQGIDFNNTEYVNGVVDPDYVVVDPSAAASSPLAALAPGVASPGYFSTTSTDFGVVGGSPLSALVSPLPGADDQAVLGQTVTEQQSTDVFFDSQGDVNLSQTDTWTETDVTATGGDSSAFQSYVEDGIDDQDYD